MNDDPLKHFRKEPPPAFAQALYERISRQPQVVLTLPENGLDGRNQQQLDAQEDTDMNGLRHTAALPFPGRRGYRLQGYLVAGIAILVVAAFSIVLLGMMLGNSIPAVVVDKATLFESYIDHVWNKGDLEEVSLFLTADHIHHDANLPEAVMGLEAVSQYIAQYRERIPGLTLTVDQVTTDGDQLTADLTATANEMTTTITLSSRFAGDKLAEVWFNASDLLTALGLTNITAAQSEIDPDAIAQNWLNIWNKRDLTAEELEAFLSPELVVHTYLDYRQERKLYGIPQFVSRKLQQQDKEMPDYQYTLRAVTAISDDVIMVTMTGAGTVADVDIAITSEENVILRLEDNKIAEAWILSHPGFVTWPNEIIDGGPITVGGDWQKGTQEPSQRVRYTLEIPEMDDPFEIVLSSDYDSILRIYDENGLLLICSADNRGYDRSEVLSDLMFEPGTIVYVEVGGYLDYYAGGYTLRIR